jgi:hypothetical protein
MQSGVVSLVELHRIGEQCWLRLATLNLECCILILTLMLLLSARLPFLHCSMRSITGLVCASQHH